MKNNRNEFVKPGGLDLKDRLVSIQRVTKVTKGGRAFGLHRRGAPREQGRAARRDSHRDAPVRHLRAASVLQLPLPARAHGDRAGRRVEREVHVVGHRPAVGADAESRHLRLPRAVEPDLAGERHAAPREPDVRAVGPDRGEHRGDVHAERRVGVGHRALLHPAQLAELRRGVARGVRHRAEGRRRRAGGFRERAGEGEEDARRAAVRTPEQVMISCGESLTS